MGRNIPPQICGLSKVKLAFNFKEKIEIIRYGKLEKSEDNSDLKCLFHLSFLNLVFVINEYNRKVCA